MRKQGTKQGKLIQSRKNMVGSGSRFSHKLRQNKNTQLIIDNYNKNLNRFKAELQQFPLKVERVYKLQLLRNKLKQQKYCSKIRQIECKTDSLEKQLTYRSRDSVRIGRQYPMVTEIEKLQHLQKEYEEIQHNLESKLIEQKKQLEEYKNKNEKVRKQLRMLKRNENDKMVVNIAKNIENEDQMHCWSIKSSRTTQPQRIPRKKQCYDSARESQQLVSSRISRTKPIQKDEHEELLSSKRPYFMTEVQSDSITNDLLRLQALMELKNVKHSPEPKSNNNKMSLRLSFQSLQQKINRQLQEHKIMQLFINYLRNNEQIKSVIMSHQLSQSAVFYKNPIVDKTSKSYTTQNTVNKIKMKPVIPITSEKKTAIELFNEKLLKAELIEKNMAKIVNYCYKHQKQKNERVLQIQDELLKIKGEVAKRAVIPNVDRCRRTSIGDYRIIQDQYNYHNLRS